MKGKEKTVLDGRSNQRLASKKFNSTESEGQKLQSTVRFEADTYRTIERIQERHGIGFAETVRKIVKEGLKAHLSQNNSTTTISGGRE
jgi:hypothetical protein